MFCITFILYAAARRSSEDAPYTDAFIDSLIVLVEQAPPLSVEAIEKSISSMNSTASYSSTLAFFCAGRRQSN